LNRIVPTLLLHIAWVLACGSLAAQDTSPTESADAPANKSRTDEGQAISPPSPTLATSSEPVLRESFDTAEADATFAGWKSVTDEYPLRPADDSHEGAGSGCLDTRSAVQDRLFAAASIELDVERVRSRRLRYSAFVKTAGIDADDRAMLAIRALRESDDGSRFTAAYDNMEDRPISATEWTKYELVIDVDTDIDTVECGVAVVGKGAIWIDDAQVEIVGQEVATTGKVRRPPVDSPFLTPWLWLAGLAMLLFSLAFIEESFVQRFCLRFSMIYWLLYLLPQFPGLGHIIQSLTWMGIGATPLTNLYQRISSGSQSLFEPLTQWTATHVLGIEGTVNYVVTGSGDTAYSYINLLNGFAISFVVATIWCFIPRLGRDHPVLRDTYRSFLRYSLATVLLGYGLAKASFIATQFSRSGGPTEFQLLRTYGESSPMGLLWTFMAASPMYTFFAGLMEVIPAVLLVFRRTTVVGAAMAFAVMLNVFLLNVCYEVPVKQFSFHLAAAAAIILLPELSRLSSCVLGNRQVEPSELLEPPYATSGLPRLIHRSLKVALVTLAFVIPIGSHVAAELSHDHGTPPKSEHALMSKAFRWVSETPDNR
jgi:hypothetical protein